MLIVLGGLAKIKQDLIRSIASERRARVVAPGLKKGRMPKSTRERQREAIKRRNRSEATREIARSYKLSRNTISRPHVEAG